MFRILKEPKKNGSEAGISVDRNPHLSRGGDCIYSRTELLCAPLSYICLDTLSAHSCVEYPVV